MSMFINLIVVIVSFKYTCVKIYKIENFKYVQFIYVHYLSEALKNLTNRTSRSKKYNWNKNVNEWVWQIKKKLVN